MLPGGKGNHFFLTLSLDYLEHFSKPSPNYVGFLNYRKAGFSMETWIKLFHLVQKNAFPQQT